MTDGIHRRDLFRTASALAMTAGSYSRVLGANDRINLGVVGCGGRGLGVMATFRKNPVVTVSAVCDVYGVQIDRALQKAPEARGFTDHRKLLEVKELDAVLIGTPDHWHAAIAIDALNVGKDVYCEKPLTLKIEEGPAIVKAARVNERICQVGMQQRSGPHYIQARDEYFRAGKLGKITLARTWWHGNGAHLRRAPASLETKPSNLDWARYLGPVKWREYDPQQYYNFRAYLEFGGGQVTDLFTHWIDVVHMFIEQDIPVSAVAAGGVYQYKNGRTAPDTARPAASSTAIRTPSCSALTSPPTGRRSPGRISGLRCITATFGCWKPRTSISTTHRPRSPARPLCIRSIGLPKPILRSVYRDDALRILG